MVLTESEFTESLGNHVMNKDIMSHSQKLRHIETVFADYYSMNNLLIDICFYITEIHPGGARQEFQTT